MSTERHRHLARTLRIVAMVAAAFCIIVGAVMIQDHRQSRTQALVDADLLVAARDRLARTPTDEAIKEEIRQLDQQVRSSFFTRKARARQGTWLLLVGAIVMVASLGYAAALTSRPPLPSSTPPADPARQAAGARWAVAVIAVFIVGAAMGVISRPELEPLAIELPPTTAPRPVLDPRLQWPRFRGPGGLGIAHLPELATAFAPVTEQHLAWKISLPLGGQSSPIIWGDRIIITAADEQRRVVYCCNASDGSILWQQSVDGGAPGKPENIYADTGYAAPTPVTDGERIIAKFANGDIAALDLDGKLLWARHLGMPDNIYGHAASPILWQDRVIVQFDQGYEHESAIMALDAASGELLWRTVREAPDTWSTPIIIETADGPQIVATGSPWINGYDPLTGAELWKVNLFYGEVVTSPVYANNLIYVSSAMAYTAAIDPVGRGELSAEELVWKNDESLPDIVSPLCDGKRLLLCMAGMLSCLDAQSGELLWEHDLAGETWASPILVGDHVYLPMQEGDVVIFSMTDGYQELGRLALDEPLNASIAVAGGRLVIRGRDHLYCYRLETAP